jgi:hypothetical protein
LLSTENGISGHQAAESACSRWLKSALQPEVSSFYDLPTEKGATFEQKVTLYGNQGVSRLQPFLLLPPEPSLPG